MMKLFLISISVIIEVTVSSIQENEWAKCIPYWVIFITDEDGIRRVPKLVGWSLSSSR
jgi:hypothetical protein